jgi:hypothetical protein
MKAILQWILLAAVILGLAAWFVIDGGNGPCADGGGPPACHRGQTRFGNGL